MGKQVIYHVTPKEYLLWALSGEEIVCQDCDGAGVQVTWTNNGLYNYTTACLTCYQLGEMTPNEAHTVGIIVLTDHS